MASCSSTPAPRWCLSTMIRSLSSKVQKGLRLAICWHWSLWAQSKSNKVNMDLGHLLELNAWELHIEFKTIKCPAWWSLKRKNERCQCWDNLKQAYFIKVPMRGIQMPYFETLWFPNQAANVYLPCGIFKAYSFKMRKNVECIYHCQFQAHIRQVILHTVSREAIST